MIAMKDGFECGGWTKMRCWRMDVRFDSVRKGTKPGTNAWADQTQWASSDTCSQLIIGNAIFPQLDSISKTVKGVDQYSWLMTLFVIVRST